MCIRDSTRDDGKGIVFEKEGEGYKAPGKYKYELEPVSSLEIKTESKTEDKKEDTDTETSQEEKVSTPSNAAVRKAVLSLEEDTSNEDPEDETEEDISVPGSTGWKISLPDGTEKYFNSNGLLVTEKDRKGLTTYYVYDSNFTLKKIISPSEKEYQITQTEEGPITDIVLPDGETLH